MDISVQHWIYLLMMYMTGINESGLMLINFSKFSLKKAFLGRDEWLFIVPLHWKLAWYFMRCKNVIMIAQYILDHGLNGLLELQIF